MKFYVDYSIINIVSNYKPKAVLSLYYLKGENMKIIQLAKKYGAKDLAELESKISEVLECEEITKESLEALEDSYVLEEYLELMREEELESERELEKQAEREMWYY